MSLQKEKKYNSPKKPQQVRERRPNFSYAGFVHSALAESNKKADDFLLQNEPLARLSYAEEYAIKNEALALFWKKHALAGTPEKLRESPQQRRYRTTSQRRVFFKGKKLYLAFGDTKGDSPKKVFDESLIEPKEHAEIYIFLQKKFSEPENRLAATHLNYLIIRGNYRERCVIFNVDLLNGAIVRRLKVIAGQLQKHSQSVQSAFIYLDPSRSGYYLESRKAAAPVQFKRLFGPAFLAVELEGRTLQFHPTSFSQVNESMVPVMLREAKGLIAPGPNERLVDLYCGYGLFSCFLSNDYRQIFGMDSEGPSIQSAKGNAGYSSGKAKIRFMAGRITADSIELMLPKKPMPETIILDPPRQGPENGVIESICHRNPGKVLHIFCGVDQIPDSLRMWKENGYEVEKAVPLDMFPGTVNLEILILLKPVSKRS